MHYYKILSPSDFVIDEPLHSRNQHIRAVAVLSFVSAAAFAYKHGLLAYRTECFVHLSGGMGMLGGVSQ